MGEILRVKQEDDNPEDCFAVCIVKGSAGGDNIIVHWLNLRGFDTNFLHFHSTIYKLPAFLLWCNFASCWVTCTYQPWLIIEEGGND